MVILNTPRLRLEPLRADHAACVFESLQCPELYTWIPEEPPTLDTLTSRYAFLEAGRSPNGEEYWLNWVAFPHGSDTPVATVQATLPNEGAGSFAYIVFSTFWRQGYGREMTAGMLDHLFETYQPPHMYAEIDTRNTSSVRLVESLGLTRTGLTRNATMLKGKPSDEYTYSISRETWTMNSSRKVRTAGHVDGE